MFVVVQGIISLDYCKNVPKTISNLVKPRNSLPNLPRRFLIISRNAQRRSP
ncbi:hypothetical protein CFP56_033935 [Quercus suber]|uniref:Uncharacterized protein n=1 Tax=Quercus suber TaxID=58331 RepID=A0AAW0JDW1_QUESU